jgi:hypothetical protein
MSFIYVRQIFIYVDLTEEHKKRMPQTAGLHTLSRAFLMAKTDVACKNNIILFE